MGQVRSSPKGLDLGVYYNPLWTTRSTVADPSVTVVGRPDIKSPTSSARGTPNPGADLWWVDVTRDGAEEYVKGYVEYFRELGRHLLCASTSWPGTKLGFDQSEGTICPAHGREDYVKALAG